MNSKLNFEKYFLACRALNLPYDEAISLLLFLFKMEYDDQAIEQVVIAFDKYKY